MNRLPLDRDDIDRTLLIGMVAGTQASNEAAAAAQLQFGIQITVDDLSSVPQQAALMSIVVTATRAAGAVGVVAPATELDRLALRGPHKHHSLRDAIIAEGAHQGPLATPTLVEIVIGDAAATVSSPAAMLRVTWDGWIARVNGCTPSRMAADPTNVLAAIAAGALAVHEAFGIFSNRVGRDDGYRDVELNLWQLDSRERRGPALRWAPSAWWLVGLGHLGQANAWALTWLGLPPDTEIVLQDDALLGNANHSTGVLTPRKPRPERKARAVARALEDSGLKTRIIEQRFAGEAVAIDQRHYVALFGVDKPDARREISGANWDHVIDVGIGATPNDFDSLLLYRFPSAGDSHSIPSWQNRAGEVQIPKTPAFDELLETHEVCGVIQLAGTAVGASFVGLFAAAVAITEAVRSLHLGSIHSVVRIDLGHWKVRSTTGKRAQSAEPPSVALDT